MTSSDLPLTPRFFARDVDRVARALIGKVLLVDGVGGTIIETESYDPTDPASHSYAGKRTPRNAVMFGPSGHAYVYLSYGIHWCLNFVCGNGSAVLIRALEPRSGLETMARRRGTDDIRLLCSGPGKLCEALGVNGAMTGKSLFHAPFALLKGSRAPAVSIGVRIGLTKAVEAERRYGWEGSRFLSKPFAPAKR